MQPNSCLHSTVANRWNDTTFNIVLWVPRSPGGPSLQDAEDAMDGRCRFFMKKTVLDGRTA